MRRWATFIFLCLMAILAICAAAGTSTRSVSAQIAVSETPIVVTAQAGTVMPVTVMPGTPAPGGQPGSAQTGVLTLTLSDSGGTFTVVVGTEIVLLVPRLPNMQLSFDPSVLQLLNGGPPPYPADPPGGMSGDPSMNPTNASPAIRGGWYLIAIGPGVTPLTAVTAPCTKPPCPEMPTIAFSVTIVVRGGANPPPGASEVYIGTAYLDKTVTVQIGQIVRLDLPYLSEQQSVQLQFNSQVLQSLAGQDLTHPQRDGWRFLVIGPGTSQLVVMTTLCTDDYNEGTTCAPTVVFEVTVTTTPSSK